MGPVDYYFLLVNAIAALPWVGILYAAKAVLLSAGLVAIFWYLVTLRKLRALAVPLAAAEVAEAQTLPPEEVAKPWQEIQSRMASPNPSDWSVAVIQADSVLDQILKASGYIGDTMGDRLKQINPAELAAIEDVWRAHKIRNRLAHGGAGTLSRQDAELAIRGYEKAFRELDYIQ